MVTKLDYEKREQIIQLLNTMVSNSSELVKVVCKLSKTPVNQTRFQELFNIQITNLRSSMRQGITTKLSDVINPFLKVLRDTGACMNGDIISFLIGIIFIFNTIIKGRFKHFLILEPFASILITFGSMWLMRYYNDFFVYILIPSSTLMYCCWYIMIGISVYELLFKK